MTISIQEINWKDLESKGFLVIPKAFDLGEIKALLSAFNISKKPGNKNYPLTNVPGTTVHIYRKKFAEEILPQIHAHTDICADYLEHGSFFATSNGVNFGWHIDPEIYYIWGDAYHYLNMYIPIQKPLLEKSNLSIVPSDVLAKHAPELAEKVVKGRGALRLIPGDGKSVVIDDNDGQVYECPFSADDLAVTPQLGVGDLLIMRGDLFHKTQDNETDRISASLRFIRSDETIRLSNFEPTCLRKAIIMAQENQTYRLRRLSFVQAGKTEMSNLEQCERFVDLMRKPPPLPFEEVEEVLIKSIGQVLERMPTVKIVVIESCADLNLVQAIFDSSNSLGAHLLVTHEKVAGFISRVRKDRALQYIVIRDLPRALETFKKSKIKLIGLQGTSKELLLASHLSSHIGFVVNGDTGLLTEKTSQICDSTLSAPLAYGRVLPLGPAAAVECGLLSLI